MNYKKFFATAQPTWKLGLRFLWGSRPYFNYAFSRQLLDEVKGTEMGKAYYCWDDMENEDLVSALMSQDRVFERAPNGGPIFHTRIAYHVENEKFVRFLEEFAAALGVNILDDTVQ
jgi:tryptophan halogenase